MSIVAKTISVTIQYGQKSKWPPFFRLNMTNRHKSHRFVDIKFIFVAICMFLRTTISNMTQFFIFHFPIWQKYKMAVIFKGTNLVKTTYPTAIYHLCEVICRVL